ncbi:MAG TPA: shikimate dehydrogenase [Chloroflexota bacterium]|nr:shikimate dehydrogenase [Chloroflexota bacterium]
MSQRWACLLGHPIRHSLSPTLHNAAFAAVGLDAHYDALDVSPAALPDAVAVMREPACLGGNVTAPHKQAVLLLLDSVSEVASALRAVNTIVNDDGLLHGDNTDGAGLARWMSEVGIDVWDQSALVLGAGGAARATVWALTRQGAARIRVLNRTLERAEALVRELGGEGTSWGRLDEAAAEQAEPWAIIINATSLGHHGQKPIVHPSCYSPDSVAIELAYNPPVTGFMEAARAAGARTENGLGMLLHQAALAFECWTRQPAPFEAYKAAVAERQRK